MNEPAINSRSRDPACEPHGPIINNFNNSLKNQKKSNSIFIHKISNLMETKYDVKRLLRTGTLLALLFAWMLTGSFVANSQIAPKATFNMDLTIVGSGTVTVSGYANPIIGPVTNSTVGPFADGSLLEITATAATGWVFTGWTGAVIDGATVTPNHIQVSGGIVVLTATFKKVVLLSNLTFTANNKPYDGNANATGSVSINPGVITAPDVVTVSYGAASFADANVGTGKTVTFTGVALGGADAAKYHLAGTTGTATANITAINLTVAGAVANNKVFDGNTTATVNYGAASLVGVIAPDVVTLVTPGTATFDTKNVGVAKTVTVSGLTLGGAAAGNYTLTQPTLSADITPKEIFYPNVVIASKVFDGTTAATIVTFGTATGLVVGEPTNVTYGPGIATFADPNVGTGKTVNIAGPATLSNTNYVLNFPFTTTGTITAPVYAMYTPTYGIVGPRPVAPVMNVPVGTVLSIEFNKSVVDVNGDPLGNPGDYVKLETWNIALVQWNLVPFTATRVGNKITITPNAALAHNTLYRIRHLNIYKTAADGGGQVVYSLDGLTRDHTIANSLQLDPEKAVEFVTQSLAAATLPTVTPYGLGKAVCGNTIKITFVNPVEYLNGLQITDNPKHKFTLQSSPDNVTWTNVASADWSVAVNTVGNPTEFTFTYIPGNLTHNYYYRIKNNIGLDLNYGFVDKVTGLTLLSGEIAFDHTQGNDGWWWSTVATYPIVVDVAPWPMSPVFPAVPVVSNAMFDASTVVSVGPAPGYALTKSTNYTADVTLIHNFVATEGEGYHFMGWKRSTNGGTSYGSLLPLTAPLVSPNLGVNYAPQSFSVSGNSIKPATCSESIGYQANFEINKYNVTTSVTPAATGTVTGAASNINHGSTVSLTAVPAAGKYFVGWNTAALPASVAATIVQNIPDHTAIGYPETGKNGTISFSLVGPLLVHGSTWNVEAIFADYVPFLYAATDPQNAFSGLVNITIEFGSSPTVAAGVEAAPFQGITYKWEQYVYGTSVKLEALGADCRYEFVKWQKWNGAAWVDFSLVNPTVFFGVTSNLRVKALYKLIDDVKVSATANIAERGTVIIFTDATRTTPRTINGVPGNQNFSHGETVYITSYPHPDYYTWRWTDAAGAPVTMGAPVRYIDRSEWTYTVGCNDIDLKAFIDLKEYAVTVKSTIAEGTINGSNPAFNAALGNQGGLGFQFSTAAGVRTGAGNFQRNSTVNFVATPAANYAFSRWETPGGIVVSTANPYSVPALHGPIDLVAKYVSTLPPPATYALTVANAPAAGGSVNLPSGNYLPGALTATATAAAGYTFTGWTATGITLTVPQQTANPLNFTMPAGAVTLTANYTPTEYTVTPVSRTYLRPHTAFTIVNWGGTVTKSPATGTFNAGETVQFTAVANPGFTFVNWMVGEILPGEILRGEMVSSTPNFTMTVPAVNGNPPMNVYAIFIEDANPGFPTYALTTAANPVGFGTVEGAGTYAHSIQVYVDETVTEPGYEFAGWSPNVMPGDYVDMTAAQHVVANYTKINYNLHVESNNPAWGSVSPASAGFVVGDLPIAVSAFAAGSTCNNSYQFAGWFTNPALTTPLLDAGGNAVVDEDFNFIPYALPYPQTDFYVYAKFVESVNTYDVTAVVAPVAAGTASISAVGPYTCGQTVTISTVANPGYEFQHWTKDGVLFIDQVTFNWNVDEDADFVAVYSAIEYDVTATAQPGGSVAPAAQIKTIGQAVEVTATANTGYAFDGWVATGVTLADAMANPATFTQPANDVSLVAKFVKINYNVTATANAGGTVAPASQVKTYGDAVTVTATPAAGYVFNGWTATGVTLADVMANPASFNMPANDVNLVASFAKIPYTVTASVVPANGGTTSALNATYYVGDAVSVTATANPGFMFTGWTATGITLATPTAATQSFTMPAGNVTLTANFQSVNNKLMGNVKYFNQFESGLPLSAGVQVALLDASNNMIGSPVSVGMDGYYEFGNIVPGTTYKVKVWEAGATLANTWSWNNWGGASAADALVISYMAAGNTVVNNFPWIAPVSAPNYTPFAVEVADVDNNGIFTGNDPLIVMRRSIGLPGYSPFPIGGTPNFQVAGGEVASLGAKVYPQAPSVVFAPMGTYAAGTAGTDFYYVGTITGKAGNTVMNLYYIAGGDVNASYVPQGGAKAQPSLSYSGVINANVGDVVSIPVAIDQAVNFNALNMGLSFDNNMIEVLSVNGYDVVNIDNNNGNVNIAWFDAAGRSASTATIVVNARILSDINAADRLFELNGLNEISDANAQVIEGVSFTASAINTNATSINEVSDLTAISYPNPFNSEATISYTMPEAGKVNVIVYNKLGQVVKVLVNEVQNAGVQTVRLSSADLNGNGTYLYKVTVEGSAKSYTVNGTLILVK